MSEPLFGFTKDAARRVVQSARWFEANGMRLGGVDVSRFAQSEKIAVIQLTGNTFTPPKKSAITLGGGRYGISIFKPKIGDLTLTANLSQADLGTAGQAGVGCNIWEVGASTHNLVTTSGTLPQLFLGFLIHIQKDLTPIYVFDGLQGGC